MKFSVKLLPPNRLFVMVRQGTSVGKEEMRVETWGFKVGMREIRLGMGRTWMGVLGIQEIWEIRMRMWVMAVGMPGIRVGMRGIRVILCVNVRVYCFD